MHSRGALGLVLGALGLGAAREEEAPLTDPETQEMLQHLMQLLAATGMDAAVAQDPEVRSALQMAGASLPEGGPAPSSAPAPAPVPVGYARDGGGGAGGGVGGLAAGGGGATMGGGPASASSGLSGHIDEYVEDEYEDEDGYGDEYYDEYDERADRKPKRPQPFELWRAAHEVERYKGDPKKMSKTEWDALVARLNEASRRKKQYLGVMQAKREAAELEGNRFAPHITRRSRELAAHNKSLPERVQALMRRRKAKLDKVREEKAQRELAEATFQPNLNKPTRTRMSEMSERMHRKVGHLLQYDVDKRIRANQRKQILQEMEDRELTFSPQINPRSSHLVARMQERLELAASARKKLEESEALTEEEQLALEGEMTDRARKRKEATMVSALLSAVEKEMERGTEKFKRIPLGPRGFSMLPGHEEETFRPKINPRSRRIRTDDAPEVHDRLFQTATLSIERRRRERGMYTRQFINTDVDVEGGINMGKAFEKDLTRGLSGSGGAGGEGGVRTSLAPHADYINLVAYEPKFDFLVRKVCNIVPADDEDDAGAGAGVEAGASSGAHGDVGLEDFEAGDFLGGGGGGGGGGASVGVGADGGR